MKLRTAVVVVNWGAPKGVEACVQSILDAEIAARDIAVVDNAHPARSSEHLRATFPGVHVVSPDENLGFAGGANAGIEWALAGGYEYVFIANNDVSVAPATIPALVAVLDAHSNVGVAGALPCYRDTGLPHFVRARINWRRGRPEIEEGEPPETEPYASEFATGCCVLLRAAALSEAGLFDASLFLYWEDADLCFRMRDAGYLTLMVPTARVMHSLSRSTGHDSPLTLYYQTRNRLEFFRRHTASRPARLWLLARVSLSRGGRGLLKRAAGPAADGSAYLRGVADFWRRRFGIRREFHETR